MPIPSDLASLPDLGVGVALRSEIGPQIAASAATIDWLELITEDFLFTPHRREAVRALRAQFPLVPHGVELSIGSEEPPEPA
ncbi:MAG: multinuclear nonheme iron-dependent oxidase [Pseudonocardia sp.]